MSNAALRPGGSGVQVGQGPTVIAPLIPHAPTHLPQTGSDPLTTAAAGSILIGDAAATGTADSFARSDHTHALAAPALPASQVTGAGTAGVATGPARADHVHPQAALAPAAHAPTHLPSGSDPLTTAAPTATGVATASAVGTAESFARSDHAHQSNTTPAAVAATAAIGTSGEPARADHVHTAAGRLIGVQRLTSGNYTKTAGTNTVIVHGIGGGGGGGGGDQGAGTQGVGGGGGSGQYITHRETGLGAGPFVATYGTAGAGGAAGNNAGTAGGASTLALSVTLTAAGGGGGASMAAASFASYAAGGFAGTGASNANLSTQGNTPGENGSRDSASQQVSGSGGSSPMGSGGQAIFNTSATGNAGTGDGAGGGGGNASSSTADKAGGAGTAGAWIIYEYT